MGNEMRWIGGHPPALKTVPDVNIPMASEMNPVAPMDRLDSPPVHSAIGAVPGEPSNTAGGGNGIRAGAAMPAYTADYYPEYRIARNFPEEDAAADQADVRGGMKSIIPLNEQRVVAKADSIAAGAVKGETQIKPVAPADRLPAGQQAVSPKDRVPNNSARHMEQAQDRQAAAADISRLTAFFGKVDANKDGAISPAEFKKELSGHQNKTAEETEGLWNKFHQTDTPFMNKQEFLRLVRTGFDLGTVSRNDLASVMKTPVASGLGFWGNGAVCNGTSFVTAVRLKVMATSNAANSDNTGVNALGMRCSDGKELTTIEGADGSWSQWAECPPGQYVFSARTRIHDPLPGMDSAGVTDLEFGCRAQDLSAKTRLRFGEKLAQPPKNVVIGVGQHAEQGGWTQELSCAPKSTLCGVSANVVRDQGAGDDAGVAGLRFYCCKSAMDCSAVCNSRANGYITPECSACTQAFNS